MKKHLLTGALMVVLPVIAAAPASAQTYAEQQRWDRAQARYQSETDIYQRERDRYMAARARDGRGSRYDDRGYSDRYGDRGYDESRFATNYDAARDYRDDPRYRERRLTDQDEVYRGSDGRYYCRRSDGTTGLVVGGAVGGILGNVLDGGRHRTAGTLIGGALGALAGRSIEQNNDIRCR